MNHIAPDDLATLTPVQAEVRRRIQDAQQSRLLLEVGAGKAPHRRAAKQPDA